MLKWVLNKTWKVSNTNRAWTWIQKKSIPSNFRLTINQWVTMNSDVGFCCFSVAHSCPTLCKPKECSTPDFLVLRHLPVFAQSQAHWVSDPIQPSPPLLSPYPPAFNLSQHQGLFQWVYSSHEVAKVLETQFKHQFLQWILRTHFL